MSEIPGDLRFMKSHEWARKEGDGSVTVGILMLTQRRVAWHVCTQPAEAVRLAEKRLAAINRAWEDIRRIHAL